MNSATSSVKSNIAANAMGRMWNAGLGVLLVPTYVHYLGVEAYGLVGFSLTLQTVFALLDFGLGITINRELARLSARPDTSHEQRNVVRTLEIIYWTVAIGIGMTVALAAPFMARSWIHPETLATSDVETALRLIGLMMTFQFPFALYQGAIAGLQAQVPLNVILIANGSFRGIGVIGALLVFGSTIQTFFAWLVLSSLLLTASLRWYLWRHLPPATEAAIFSKGTIQRIGRFALGMSGVSMTSVLLLSADKMVLSSRLSLRQFGFYSLAWTMATVTSLVVAPINFAMFPRFSQLISVNEQGTLSHLYHSACQLVSVGIMPIVAVTVLFAPEILMAWTGNPTIVAEAAPLLALLTIGSAVNGLVNMPYTLQLSLGWTKLAFYANMVALVVLVPALLVLAGPLGAMAGALFWMAVNVGPLLVNVNIMHTRILPGEAARWYLQDLGLPLVGALAAAGSVRLLYHGGTRGADLLVVLLAGLLALAAAVVMAPLTRRAVVIQILRRVQR